MLWYASNTCTNSRPDKVRQKNKESTFSTIFRAKVGKVILRESHFSKFPTEVQFWKFICLKMVCLTSIQSLHEKAFLKANFSIDLKISLLFCTVYSFQWFSDWKNVNLLRQFYNLPPYGMALCVNRQSWNYPLHNACRKSLLIM